MLVEYSGGVTSVTHRKFKFHTNGLAWDVVSNHLMGGAVRDTCIHRYSSMPPSKLRDKNENYMHGIERALSTPNKFRLLQADPADRNESVCGGSPHMQNHPWFVARFFEIRLQFSQASDAPHSSPTRIRQQPGHSYFLEVRDDLMPKEVGGGGGR